jgi:hypothetical protein
MMHGWRKCSIYVHIHTYKHTYIYIYTYICSEVAFSHKEEQNYIIFREMGGTEGHNVKWNKTDSERQSLDIFCYILNLDFKKKDGSNVEGRFFGKRKGTSGRRRTREDTGWWTWLKYFVYMYENIMRKPIKMDPTKKEI